MKLTSFRLNYRVDEIGQNAGLVVGTSHGTSGSVAGKVLMDLELTAVGVVGLFVSGGDSERWVFAPSGYGRLTDEPVKKGGKA